jgi:hypothetical protein
MAILKPKTGKWIKADAVRVNRNGTISIKTRSNPRNIAAGAYDAGGVFHPFRSSPDYDPDRAGDEYGARTDNKGFTRKRKGSAVKKAKAKTKKRKR